MHITARRWFQRTCGNTYHTVTIHLDNGEVLESPMCYGYGDQWVSTARHLLFYTDNHLPENANCTFYLREHGISYDVIDVQRKRDL